MGTVCDTPNNRQGFNDNAEVQIQTNIQRLDPQAPLPVYAIPSDLPTLSTHFQKIIAQNSPLKQQSDSGKQLEPYRIINKNIIYFGQWKGKKPFGKGCVFTNNGAYFEGYFKDGKAQCQDGLFIYPDGSYYRGQIRNSQIIGKGQFKSATLSVIYKGQWKNNKPHGYGTQNFSDKNVYIGNFVNGLKHGQGHFMWNNGFEYKGEFKQGYIDGQGTYQRNEQKYSGNFYKNMKHSNNGKLRTINGTYQGPFLNGQMHGQGVFQWNDGKIYRGDFFKNKLHGEGKIQYPNGQIVYGQWRNGQNILIHKFDSVSKNS